jgi:hypothetical protein
MADQGSVTDPERHFNTVIGCFRTLVRWVAVFGSAVLVSFGALYWKDRNDLQAQITTVRERAEESIKAVEEQAKRRIDQIRDDAGKVAITEAQRRVEEAFHTSNVAAMVQTAAQREVGAAVGQQLQREVDHALATVQGDIDSLAGVSDAAMRMRFGFRQGLDDLKRFSAAEVPARTRTAAMTLLQSITRDYETRMLELLDQSYDRKAVNAVKQWLEVADDATVPTPAIVKIIRSDATLDQVAIGFLALRQRTGTPFRMFDFAEVERWCSTRLKECGK